MTSLMEERHLHLKLKVRLELVGAWLRGEEGSAASGTPLTGRVQVREVWEEEDTRTSPSAGFMELGR